MKNLEQIVEAYQLWAINQRYLDATLHGAASDYLIDRIWADLTPEEIQEVLLLLHPSKGAITEE